MSKTIFYSWQSDLNPRETRGLIREALATAIEQVAADFDEAERPEIDHDTKGVAGSPEIVATILAKIDTAAAFVADITPIAVSESGKHISNPNVAIELGYAKKSLTPERVITVWNTAIAGSTLADLPFDMRHRRGPISFHLPVGAHKSQLRDARSTLVSEFTEAIKACLKLTRNEHPIKNDWQRADSQQPSIWADGDQTLVINTGYGGSKKFALEAAPRMFIRLLPATWSARPDALQIFEQQATTLVPLGKASYIGWGATRGGFISYRTSEKIESEGLLPTATRWFRSNGEIWGIASSAFHTPNDGDTYFLSGYAAERWLGWLQQNLKVCEAVGGVRPFSISAGIDGIENTFWPTNSRGRSYSIEAVEEKATHSFEVSGPSDPALEEGVFATFNAARLAYGLEPSSKEEFMNSMR